MTNMSYAKECQQELENDPKFVLTEVTEEQAVLILEPNHAPENFYCDGEVTHFQAMESWMERLKNAGLNPYHRTMVKAYIFG